MPDNYYFPHDYNAIQDPKMMRLLRECGMGGIGFYWTIVEILHQQPNGKITVEAFDDYANLYLRYEGSGTDCIDKIKQMLSKTKLLRMNQKYVWSPRVLKNHRRREELTKIRAEAGRIGGMHKAGIANAKQKIANAKHEMKGNEKKRNINTSDYFLEKPTQKTIKMATDLKAKAYALIGKPALVN